jgi:hypothetical protein
MGDDLTMEDWGRYEPKFRYMMLSRMKQDCDYYLGNGNRSTNILWAQDERSQIENVIALWKTFDKDDKPEWLTWADIVEYAQRMDIKIESALPRYIEYFRKNREDDDV